MALINTLRKKAGKIVVGFVAFSMFAFILTDLFNSNSGLFSEDNTIGQVGSEEISYANFQGKVDQLAYNFSLNTGRSPLSSDMEMIRQQAWQQFIVENIFYGEYDELGIEVTNSELVDMVQGANIHPQIRQLFSDPNTGQFNRENIIGFLQQLNQAPPQQRQSWLAFEASLAPTRKLNKYENLLELTKYANKHEAKAEYEKTAAVDVEYLYVPFFSVSDSTVSASDSELQSYLNENSDAYQRDGSKDASYVVFDVVPSADDSAFVRDEVALLRDGLINSTDDSTFVLINSDGLTPFGTYNPNNLPAWLTDAGETLEPGFVSETKVVGNTYSFFKVSDIKDGDEAYVKASHILFKAANDTDAAKADAKAEAQRVLNEIRRGANFAEMARLYGTDGTASRGGDLGWFGENGNFDQDFKDAAFAKRGTGLINNVVETSFGYHLIEVTEPKNSTVYKIASIEKELFATDQTINEIYREAQMFATSSNSAASFEEQAAAGGYDVKKAIRINQNDKRLGSIQEARSVVFWLFNEASNDKVSDVFELDNKYIVAVQTNEQEEGTAQLRDVRNEISRKVLDEKKAADLIAKLSGMSGSYEEMSSAYGSGARTGSGNITLGTNSFPNIGFAPEAIGVAFSLEEGESTLPFKTQNGVIMLTVTSKTTPAELGDYEAYRGVVINAQRDLRRREEPFTYQGIYNALTESADIEDNRYKFY